MNTTHYKMEKTLKLDLATARSLYPKASSEFKELLEKNFTQAELNPDIRDRVKNMRDVCELAGKNYDDFMRFCSTLPRNTAGFEKVKLICKALNQGWIADYLNQNQKKWFPRFYREQQGFVFNGATYGYNAVCSGVPVTALKSEELAIFASKVFLEEYNDYFAQ